MLKTPSWTLLALWAVFVTLPELARWAVFDAVWQTDDPSACREAAGACWAVVQEKHRVMLFGTFPYDQHWRGALAILIVCAMAVISGFKRFWSYWLLGRGSPRWGRCWSFSSEAFWD